MTGIATIPGLQLLFLYTVCDFSPGVSWPGDPALRLVAEAVSAAANGLDPNVVTAQLYLDAGEVPGALQAAIELHAPRTDDDHRLAETLLDEVDAQCQRVLAWFG